MGEKTTRGSYTEAQKAEVMEMLQANVKVPEIEQITGVKAGTIYRWRSEAKVFEEKNTSKNEEEESSKDKIFEEQASKILSFEEDLRELRRFQKATIAAFRYILDKDIDDLERKDISQDSEFNKSVHNKTLNRKRLLRDAFCGELED